MAPFYGWGSTTSRLEQETVYILFTTGTPVNLWRMDEKLSQTWSHPVVLNMEPLDWESSALITRPLLHAILGNEQLKQKFSCL